jgi:hypothetical protein
MWNKEGILNPTSFVSCYVSRAVVIVMGLQELQQHVCVRLVGVYFQKKKKGDRKA